MNKQLVFPQIDGFSLSISHDEPLKDLEGDATLVVAEEKTEIVLGRHVYALSKGDALLALPFMYCRRRGDDSFHGYQLRFPLDALRTLAPHAYLSTIDGGKAMPFSTEERTRLLSLCEALSAGTLAAIYALPSVFSVLEKSCYPETENELEIHLPKLLRRALSYIEEQAPHLIDAALLAERYGTSQSTISRLFRTHLETTPRKYAQAIGRLHEQMQKY